MAANDSYCALTIAAGLAWRDVVLVRSMCRFIRQTELGFSENHLIDTLARHSTFTEAVVEQFHVKFDPRIDDHARRVAELDARLAALLEETITLDEDSILRAVACSLRAPAAMP